MYFMQQNNGLLATYYNKAKQGGKKCLLRLDSYFQEVEHFLIYETIST